MTCLVYYYCLLYGMYNSTNGNSGKSYMSLGSEEGLIFGNATMFPSQSNWTSFHSPLHFFHVICATCTELNS